MLRLLRRLLGWDTNPGHLDFDDLVPPVRQTTSRPKTGHPKTSHARQVAAPQPVKPAPAKAAAARAEPGKPPRERTASDILDNPELSLNAPQDEGFDPYNTGAFNRSSSWEKISKHRANR